MQFTLLHHSSKPLSHKYLALWGKELLQHQLIDLETFQKATSQHNLPTGEAIDYGYGFLLSGGGSAEKLVYHTGGWPGYFCIMMHFPDQQKQIVVLSNNAFDGFTRLADDVAGMLLGE